MGTQVPGAGSQEEQRETWPAVPSSAPDHVRRLGAGHQLWERPLVAATDRDGKIPGAVNIQKQSELGSWQLCDTDSSGADKISTNNKFVYLPGIFHGPALC